MIHEGVQYSSIHVCTAPFQDDYLEAFPSTAGSPRAVFS